VAALDDVDEIEKTAVPEVKLLNTVVADEQQTTKEQFVDLHPLLYPAAPVSQLPVLPGFRNEWLGG